MLNTFARFGRLAMIFLVAALFTGCISKVPMPKGTSKGYTSYRYIAPNEALGADDLPVFVSGNRMIKEAVASQMTKNGIKADAEKGQLIVAHLIIMQDNISTSYSNQYYGLQDISDIVTMAHKVGTSKHYPEKVQKRALVIDLLDASTYQLVYRNFIVGGTLNGLPEAERKAEIDKAVAATLEDFFRK